MTKKINKLKVKENDGFRKWMTELTNNRRDKLMTSHKLKAELLNAR